MRVGVCGRSHEWEMEVLPQAPGSESWVWLKGSWQIMPPALPVTRQFLLKRLGSATGGSYNRRIFMAAKSTGIF